MHCRYLDEILGDNDRRELKRQPGILFLTKQLDPNEEYFHVEGSIIWRKQAWLKDCEATEARRKRQQEDNDKLDKRKKAYYDIAEGIAAKIKGLDNNLIFKLAERLLNDNNVGGAWYFTDGKVNLTEIPPLPFPRYENLDNGITLTS